MAVNITNNVVTEDLPLKHLSHHPSLLTNQISTTHNWTIVGEANYRPASFNLNIFCVIEADVYRTPQTFYAFKAMATGFEDPCLPQAIFAN